jgi:hypothetical protein
MAADGDIELVITLDDGQIVKGLVKAEQAVKTVSYTHLRAHETLS